MKKASIALVTTIVTSMLSVLGLAVTAAPAEAATCFRTVNVTGSNAYGYGKPYSWDSWSKFVRTAPAATLCINYAKAYGGYYIAQVTCSQSSARLNSHDTVYVRGSNQVAAAYWQYASCRSTATWKWRRTIGNDQCANLWAQSRWNLNQSTGTVTHASSSPQDDYFVPATC